MTDEIVAYIEYDNNITVPTVGIQGLSASDMSLGNLNDIDASSLVNGSVLVYKTSSNKWTSTLLLDQQYMEGGEF